MSLCTEEKCLPATENGFAFGSEDTTVDSAFLICRELGKRNPELPNPSELFRDLCRNYC